MTALSCRTLRDGQNILGGYKKYDFVFALPFRCIRVFELERPGREVCSVDRIRGIVSTIDDYASCVAVQAYCSLNASLVHLMEWFLSLMLDFSAMRIQLLGVRTLLLMVCMKFD